jgi:hypothetical protein
MMTDENQFPAQAENVNFEKMLNEFADSVYHAGAKERALPPYAAQEQQALLAYVARLEARQMHPDFDEMYALFVRDEKRGDPALRGVRFAGYAAAFFTRFLRMVDPDWANEEGEE